MPEAFAAAMPTLTRSMISSCSYSAEVASMFSNKRPPVVAGSIPSWTERTAIPGSRGRLTVFNRDSYWLWRSVLGALLRGGVATPRCWYSCECPNKARMCRQPTHRIATA